MTILMPEPVAYFYQRDFDKYKDKYPGGIPVITTDQAEAYADARVREALTEIAEMCDNVFSFSVGDSVRDLMYKMLSKNNTIDKC